MLLQLVVKVIHTAAHQLMTLRPLTADQLDFSVYGLLRDPSKNFSKIMKELLRVGFSHTPDGLNQTATELEGGLHRGCLKAIVDVTSESEEANTGLPQVVNSSKF